MAIIISENIWSKQDYLWFICLNWWWSWKYTSQLWRGWDKNKFHQMHSVAYQQDHPRYSSSSTAHSERWNIFIETHCIMHVIIIPCWAQELSPVKFYPRLGPLSRKGWWTIIVEMMKWWLWNSPRYNRLSLTCLGVLERKRSSCQLWWFKLC